MALYSLADIVTIIRGEINEPVARIFTDEELGNFIEQGVMAVSGITLCEEKEEITVSADTKFEYALTADFIEIESVEWYLTSTQQIPHGLQRVHPTVFGNQVDNAIGEPRYYTFWNNDIYIWPYFNDADHSIKVRGYIMAAGAITALDENIKLLPFYYAMAMVYARLGKHRLSALRMQRFISECNQWRIDINKAITRVDTNDMAHTPDVTITPQ